MGALTKCHTRSVCPCRDTVLPGVGVDTDDYTNNGGESSQVCLLNLALHLSSLPSFFAFWLRLLAGMLCQDGKSFWKKETNPSDRTRQSDFGKCHAASSSVSLEFCAVKQSELLCANLTTSVIE